MKLDNFCEKPNKLSSDFFPCTSILWEILSRYLKSNVVTYKYIRLDTSTYYADYLSFKSCV